MASETVEFGTDSGGTEKEQAPYIEHPINDSEIECLDIKPDSSEILQSDTNVAAIHENYEEIVEESAPHETCSHFDHPLLASNETLFPAEDGTSSVTSIPSQCCEENFDTSIDGPLSMSDGSKDNALQNDLLSLGLKQEDIEFIFENGDKFLEKQALLAKKLRISLTTAKSAIETYKSFKQESTSETNLTQDIVIKIEDCMKENPEFDSAEDIAILCEIDETLVAAYFESKPLNDTQKADIKEKLNAGYPIDDIAIILKISISKVKDFVERTFLAFDGKKGQITFDIIGRNFPEVNCSKLRDMIISKNLKLQDQLGCILHKHNNDEYQVIRKYIENFEESKSFFEIDIGLTIEDIKYLIKQSSFLTIEELSIKLHRVETVIRDFLEQYHPNTILSNYCTDMQRKQLREIVNNFAKVSISFHTYRMIISNSFKEIIDRAEQCKQSPMAVFNELLPLAFYYLKCSLPLDDITQIISNTSRITLTTHDLFHILFQLSDPVLRGYCIKHYSFSNPVPLYYPNLNGKYEMCKELWYSLQEFNGLVSFGLGRAGWNPIGKSYLLDFIFGTDFVRGNPQKSAFHFNSIDIQMTKNLFVEKDKKSDESTKWAYIDCHGHSNFEVIQVICLHLDVSLIHISYLDYTINRKSLVNDLSFFRKNVKYVYCLIRDYEGIEVKVVRFPSGITCFLIPNLTKQETDIHSVKKSLKEIGYEILHLKFEKPKNIGSNFLENVIGKLDPLSIKEILFDKQILQTITNHIRKMTQSSQTIDFSFLSYYPLFIKYMSHYYKAAYALDQKNSR